MLYIIPRDQNKPRSQNNGGWYKWQFDAKGKRVENIKLNGIIVMVS